MTSTRPTLATIAEALSVSRMTVSNAFNRPDQLSPELRERVLAKAQELGYGGPDPQARALSRGRTGSIGVILDAPLTLAFSDPAAVQLLHGVATVCEQQELGMSLVPRITGRDAELVKTALVDGFVVYCMGDDDPRRAAMTERHLPYALIDDHPDSADLTVNIDDRGAARIVVAHAVHDEPVDQRGLDQLRVPARDPRHERDAELLLLAHGGDAVQQLDRRRVAERERERGIEDHADAAGAAARQRARLRVRTAVPELLRLGQHPLAQLRGELVRAVERVGHRHPRNAERFGDGRECGTGAGHLYR